MKYRDIQFLLQTLFNVKTLRGFNILEVYSSKGWGDRLYHSYEFLNILFIHFDIKHIYIGKYFEQQSFSFHYRFTRQRTNVAQAQNGCTICNNRHQVAFGGINVGIFRVLLDLQAGFRHTRSIG